MRVLVYGAGVLGSNLAFNLNKSKNDVTLLARGSQYDFVKENGIVIKSKLSLFKKCQKVTVINKLDESDIYDIIFVVLRQNQLDSIIDVLKVNKSKCVVFVGNNSKPKYYQNELSDKTVLFGFSSSAGQRKNNIVYSVGIKKITIGRIDKTEQSNDLINTIFKNTGYHVTINNDMSTWLIYHQAFVVPLAAACYHGNGSIKYLSKDKEYMMLMYKATKEEYEAIKALGYTVNKEEEDWIKDSKSPIKFYKLMSKTFLGNVCICNHANNAKDEMDFMAKNMLEEINKSKVGSTNFETLYKDYLNY